LSIEPNEAAVAARPLPQPDDVSEFFWEGARKGQLLVQRCARCDRFQYPPDVACIHCQSLELEPSEVSGRGTLYSYTVVDRVFHAGFTDALPYVVGLVELDEQPGLRLLTNILDVEPDALRVGMRLEVAFEEREDMVLPQFRAVEGNG
jgi:uncharacterized OB-fold protein